MAVILVILGIYTAQSAMAADDGNFTNASLQGNYAYINNNADVASLGPITFNGRGGLTVDILANLPCNTPVPNCSRSINDVPPVPNGTYSVATNGTGVATIPFSTGTVAYNFIISETEKKGRILLATKVFAVGRKGGLSGQLIAPTWSRISD
ncbi:hypothetical protein H6G76_34060 [Nostoc sp. FACHB-152]|uniref:hypothetical protein n=1 Tax=unclassified Nostoc TaxID=2593658 RepID=UPI0016863176|nr:MULTISPECIES: hypothetical protein [unclassified Nostoc]MBD2452052.1 hypothetical protein [Nostoc sp. FACHB-152]MBD2468406.1 hypothetical protein [Nostoc sp. FACHB-145]